MRNHYRVRHPDYQKPRQDRAFSEWVLVRFHLSIHPDRAHVRTRRAVTFHHVLHPHAASARPLQQILRRRPNRRGPIAEPSAFVRTRPLPRKWIHLLPARAMLPVLMHRLRHRSTLLSDGCGSSPVKWFRGGYPVLNPSRKPWLSRKKLLGLFLLICFNNLQIEYSVIE